MLYLLFLAAITTLAAFSIASKFILVLTMLSSLSKKKVTSLDRSLSKIRMSSKDKYNSGLLQHVLQL